MEKMLMNQLFDNYILGGNYSNILNNKYIYLKDKGIWARDIQMAIGISKKSKQM